MAYTAHNGRFHASGGVCPQKHLYEFASVSPAQTFVNPRLREAAGRCASAGDSAAEQRSKKEKRILTVRKDIK